MGGHSARFVAVAMALSFAFLSVPASALPSADTDARVETDGGLVVDVSPGVVLGHEAAGALSLDANESALMIQFALLAGFQFADYQMGWLGNTTFMAKPSGGSEPMEASILVGPGPGDNCVTLTSAGGYDISPEHCKPFK